MFYIHFECGPGTWTWTVLVRALSIVLLSGTLLYSRPVLLCLTFFCCVAPEVLTTPDVASGGSAMLRNVS